MVSLRQYILKAVTGVYLAQEEGHMFQEIALWRALPSLILRFSYQTAVEHPLVDGNKLPQVARMLLGAIVVLPGIHSSLG